MGRSWGVGGRVHGLLGVSSAKVGAAGNISAPLQAPQLSASAPRSNPTEQYYAT